MTDNKSDNYQQSSFENPQTTFSEIIKGKVIDDNTKIMLKPNYTSPTVDSLNIGDEVDIERQDIINAKRIANTQWIKVRSGESIGYMFLPGLQFDQLSLPEPTAEEGDFYDSIKTDKKYTQLAIIHTIISFIYFLFVGMPPSNQGSIARAFGAAIGAFISIKILSYTFRLKQGSEKQMYYVLLAITILWWALLIGIQLINNR